MLYNIYQQDEKKLQWYLFEGLQDLQDAELKFKNCADNLISIYELIKLLPPEWVGVFLENEYGEILEYMTIKGEKD